MHSLSGQGELDEVQGRTLEPESRHDLRVGRVDDGDAVQFAAICGQNDQREFGVGCLAEYLVVHVRYHVRDQRPLVALEDDVFLVRVANGEQMMAPRIDEVDETVQTSVVEASGDNRLVVLLRDVYLYQFPLVRVIEKSAILKRIRDQEIRLPLRLHVPHLLPHVQPGEFLVERYLTVGRTQYEAVLEPLDYRQILLYTNVATLPDHDPIDVTPVVIAQIDVAFLVDERQQRLRGRRGPIRAQDSLVFRKL